MLRTNHLQQMRREMEPLLEWICMYARHRMTRDADRVKLPMMSPCVGKEKVSKRGGGLMVSVERWSGDWSKFGRDIRESWRCWVMLFMVTDDMVSLKMTAVILWLVEVKV